ncbi:MAG TPA: phosphatase PAP2 family protein [Bacillota bacterium]|nr:MAG: PAP2 superfamily protein [Firmicutes bacterium ADurb.Bin153]HNV33969.1 phosphatase PAP2 family protein [Bacillota bacterium]HPU96073.1 phosphatase PAP2 family protein [Bacillota bacterium]
MEIVLWLRSFSSAALDGLLGYVTELGSTMFYLVAVPIVYWCMDRRSGYVVGLTVLSGGICTDLAKAVINAPRPFEVDQGVKPSLHFLKTATGSGMPSGHAFNSMAFWTAASMRLKKAWFCRLSAVLILLIGFTRVYAGVHFPAQVLWGWAGGIVTAVIVATVTGLWQRRVKGGLEGLALIIAAAVALLYTFVPALSSTGADDYVGLVGIAGGMSLGYYLHAKFVKSSAKGPILCQLAKLVIGFAGFLGLRYLADLGSEAYPALCLPFYFLLGAWPTFVSTALFKALRLERQ